MRYTFACAVQIHQNLIDVISASNDANIFIWIFSERIKPSFSRANHGHIGVDCACEARPNDATVIRFKLLIECVEDVCPRLDLECWANIHDEINLDRTDGQGDID